MEVGLARNQVGSGLEVDEDKILVYLIDTGEGSQQLAEVNLRATDTTRDQIQGVNANPSHERQAAENATRLRDPDLFIRASQPFVQSRGVPPKTPGKIPESQRVALA